MTGSLMFLRNDIPQKRRDIESRRFSNTDDYYESLNVATLSVSSWACSFSLPDSCELS